MAATSTSVSARPYQCSSHCRGTRAGHRPRVRGPRGAQRPTKGTPAGTGTSWHGVPSHPATTSPRNRRPRGVLGRAGGSAAGFSRAGRCGRLRRIRSEVRSLRPTGRWPKACWGVVAALARVHLAQRLDDPAPGQLVLASVQNGAKYGMRNDGRCTCRELAKPPTARKPIKAASSTEPRHAE